MNIGIRQILQQISLLLNTFYRMHRERLQQPLALEATGLAKVPTQLQGD